MVRVFSPKILPFSGKVTETNGVNGPERGQNNPALVGGICAAYRSAMESVEQASLVGGRPRARLKTGRRKGRFNPPPPRWGIRKLHQTRRSQSDAVGDAQTWRCAVVQANRYA